MKKVIPVFIILVVAAALVLVGCKTTRSGYESAPYKVARSDGKFELRDYPALTVVEATMARTGTDADSSFNRLFGFITGHNEAKQNISMTTPVFMSGTESNRTMAFVLPAKITSAQAPKPADPSVKVRTIEAGRFAVFRFSGGRSSKHEAEAIAQLKSWLAAQNLAALSEPIFGYFDPPWTPAFLRRNEVMLRTPSGQP